MQSLAGGKKLQVSDLSNAGMARRVLHVIPFAGACVLG